MPFWGYFSRFFLVLGLIFLLLGVLFYFIEKVPWVGKLPGDIVVRKKNFVFYFPLTTCLLLSFFLSLLAWIFLKK